MRALELVTDEALSILCHVAVAGEVARPGGTPEAWWRWLRASSHREAARRNGGPVSAETPFPLDLAPADLERAGVACAAMLGAEEGKTETEVSASLAAFFAELGAMLATILGHPEVVEELRTTGATVN